MGLSSANLSGTIGGATWGGGETHILGVSISSFHCVHFFPIQSMILTKLLSRRASVIFKYIHMYTHTHTHAHVYIYSVFTQNCKKLIAF